MPTTEPAGDIAKRQVEAVWRIESAGVVATLARHTADLGLAEDLAQDAFLAALAQWPAEGVPASPRAWLLTVAKRRYVDMARRHAALAARVPRLENEARQGHLAAGADAGAAEEEAGADVKDDILALVFCCCHPVLSEEARVALTLRAVAGLTTAQIARAFLIPERTAAQRIVRAKRRLAEAGVSLALPPPAQLSERAGSVLDVVYLVFNEGYVATAGAAWSNRQLCAEALRLGRALAALLPGEAEVHGLVALMELQSSRLRARTDASGQPVLLGDQDRRLWDRLLVRRGLEALAKACPGGQPEGPFAIQAAIAACHARAGSVATTDWEAIVELYSALAQVAPSPMVELNRAVAIAFAYGPEAALAEADRLSEDKRLVGHHLYWSARADFLERLGDFAGALSALERAAALTSNAAELTLLERRKSGLATHACPGPP